MIRILKSHMVSITLVTVILGALFIRALQNRRPQKVEAPARLQKILSIDGMDWDNAFDRALLHDVLDIIEPQQKSQHKVLLHSLQTYRQSLTERLSRQTTPLPPLNGARLLKLLIMYIRFIIIYVLVMLITYYGVQSLAVWRFVLYRQRRLPFLQYMIDLFRNKPPLRNRRERFIFIRHIAVHSGKVFLKGLFYLILFAPAYVIAYSLKSNFDTSSDLFMIILGVVSNGLLIHYANKFFTLLVSENRKGYVETALVKNLRQSFDFNAPDGIHWRDILKPRKDFTGHVLQHIYRNAAFQYLGSLKEQASFVISGLMIIEMALNIHEHLSYELLKQLLYKNYAEVILIVAAIFYLVKITEIVSDFLRRRAEEAIE